MKKVMFFVFVGILFFISTISANASDYFFIWSNTIVEVPIYGNISEYLQYPSATLYHNGSKVQNQSLSYLRTGSGLHLLEDVDTSKVGKYQVLYKVYDYNIQTGNCDGYSQLITFDVKDLISPVISVSKREIDLSYLVTSYDYTGLFVSKDNVEVISSTVDDSNVHYGVLGNYNVMIYASDGYNITKESITVNIVDRIPPVLEFCNVNNRLVVEYEEYLKIDFPSYFTAVDGYDGNVIQSLEILNLDEYDIGNYMLKARVSDSSNNYSFWDFELVILDRTLPTLELVSSSIEIDIKEIESIDLLEYVLKAEDNYSTLNKMDVKILGEIKKEVGEYIIEYSLVDEAGNSTKKELVLLIVSYIGPIITITNPIIELGESVELLDYVQVEDATDQNVKNTVKIMETNLNIYKEGVYYATISASNSSGIFSYKTMLVTVKKTQESSEDFSYGIVIIMIVVAAIAAGIIYYYKKSGRNT